MVLLTNEARKIRMLKCVYFFKNWLDAYTSKVYCSIYISVGADSSYGNVIPPPIFRVFYPVYM